MELLTKLWRKRRYGDGLDYDNLIKLPVQLSFNSNAKNSNHVTYLSKTPHFELLKLFLQGISSSNFRNLYFYNTQCGHTTMCALKHILYRTQLQNTNLLGSTYKVPSHNNLTYLLAIIEDYTKRQ